MRNSDPSKLAAFLAVVLFSTLIIDNINTNIALAFVPSSHKTRNVFSSSIKSTKNYTYKRNKKSTRKAPNESLNNNNKEPSEILKQQNHFFSQKKINDVLDRCFMQENENKKITKENKELMLKLCQAANLSRPSKIQYLAWPKLLQGNHVIIGDQTGSGKTLGYLLPLLHRMMTQAPKANPINNKVSPKLIILAPTAELAQQVSKVCKSIAKYMSFSTLCITATDDDKTPVGKQIIDIKRNTRNIDVIGKLHTISFLFMLKDTK